jgi:hypothetical protein
MSEQCTQDEFVKIIISEIRHARQRSTVPPASLTLSKKKNKEQLSYGQLQQMLHKEASSQKTFEGDQEKKKKSRSESLVKFDALA